MSSKRIQKIGLTGSIGAGKSTVAARLRSLGAFVLDADAISRKLLEKDGECYEAACALFPEAVGKDGVLDRKQIASVVFSDCEKRDALNALIHPAVILRMHREAETYLSLHPDGTVIYDVPLLIECGTYRDMDRVLVVVADDEVRLARILHRDNCTAEQAKARFLAQMPQEEKLRYADDVIDNSFSLAHLYDSVDRIYHAMTDGEASK